MTLLRRFPPRLAFLLAPLVLAMAVSTGLRVAFWLAFRVAAGLIGSPVLNTTMGCDLLDPRMASGRHALIMTKRGVQPGLALVGSDFYLTMNADGGDVRLYGHGPERPVRDVADLHRDRAREMSELCLGLYETARYLLYHNARTSYPDAEARRGGERPLVRAAQVEHGYE